MKKILAGLFGLMTAVLLAPVGAHAMTISPPNYDYTSVNRGDVIMDVIKISNEGKDVSMTLYPYVANFTFKQGDEEGGTPVFYDAQTDPYGTAMAKWIKLDTKPIVIKPGARAMVPFSINVPADASPGGHYGTVVFADQPPDDKGVVTIGSQEGVLIMMRINGDVKEAGGITEFGFAKPKPWYNFLPVSFFVRFENTGNVHLRPTGNLFITDLTGRQVASVVVNPEFRSVLPKSIRKFSFNWTKQEGGATQSALWNEWHNFAIGRHKAQLVLLYGNDNKMVTGELAFYVWPWRLICIALGILLLIIFLFTIGKNSFERSIIRKYERKQHN
jgi:hypothetical protein